MMLARWFLPLLWSTVRPHAGTSHDWGRPQSLTYAPPLAARRGFPPSQPQLALTGLRTQQGMVWRLALVAFVLATLALSLPGAASLVAGETVSLLRVMTLGSAASSVFGR